MMRHYLALAAAALLFSTGGAAVKLSQLSGWQVACLRSAIAAMVLAAFIKPTRAIFHYRTLLVGLPYATTMVLFVLSNKLTSAANAIFLQGSAPLYILVMGPWLLNEKLRRSDYLLMLTIALGLGLFFVELGQGSSTAPNPQLGNILAAAAGMSWALTLTGLRWLEQPPKSGANDRALAASAERIRAPARRGLQAVFVGNLLASLISLPLALPVSPSAADWSVLGYLGVVQIGLAYLLLTYGFRRVGAFQGSLIVLLEPALSPLWAWLIHDEVPGTLALLGGALIVAATTTKGWLDNAAQNRIKCDQPT